MSNKDLTPKLLALKNGERVITNDAELDLISELAPDIALSLCTIPNPTRCGILDQYEGWINIVHPEDEEDPRVVIPFKAGHYQFTFRTSKDNDGKWIRRIYKDREMNDLHRKAKTQALKEYPKSYAHVMHSPQTDD